jgi:hypothetical protein
MRKMAMSLALALSILHASAADAQTPVAVLGVEAVDAPLNMANLLALALQNRVRQTSGYKLVAGKELEEIKLVFGCVDEKPTCMAKAGRSLNASKLTWGSLKKTAAGYNLTIKWLDVDGARIEKFVSENIGRKELSQGEATQVIARLTRSFLVSSSGMIKVSCSEEGAQVSLGARVVATTEADAILLRDVPAGTHLVRITKEGYQPWTQQVMVQGGETTEVDAELVEVEGGTTPIPPTTPTKKPSNTGWKVAFWTGAAVTVGLAVGFGITGSKVLTAKEDKEDAIGKYRDQSNLGEDGNPLCPGPDCHKAFSGDDACDDLENHPRAADVKDACDQGDKYATITNALIASTLVVAAVSGYLYYKAYISRPSAEEKPSDADDADTARPEPVKPTWMVSPTVGPHGAGFGFEMKF